MTELEIIATITGIISVALQAKEKVIAWPFAIVSVSILAYIFLFEKLYSDLGLHVIYIILNIYGWILWSQKKDTESVTPTKLLSQNGMVYSASTTIIGCGLLGYMMSTYTDADLPFFDAFTTSGSLVAQYLLAKKYLQNSKKLMYLLYISFSVSIITISELRTIKKINIFCNIEKFFLS